jgi:GT2 family glycosyltransferase
MPAHEPGAAASQRTVDGDAPREQPAGGPQTELPAYDGEQPFGPRERITGAAPAKPRFSVIFITKSRPAALRDALESALRAVPADGEVMVIDGDPERSGASVASEVRERYPDAQLRYLASDAGISLQRNAGLDAARGEVVILLDDDCTCEPDLFVALMAAYADPSVVGATGHIEGPQQGRVGSNAHSRLRWLALGAGRQGSMSSFGFRHPIIDVAEPRDVEFMPGPLMSARRELAVQVRFDERLTGYSLGEDDDFSYRLSRHGRIRYQPSALVYHRELGVKKMDRRQLDRLRVINRAYLFRKNFAQTIRARARFAAFLAMLLAHRALNREWSGLRGLLEGVWHVYGPGARGRERRAAAR